MSERPLPKAASPVTIRFRGGRSTSVHFEGIAAVPALMEARGLEKDACLVVTDENVARLHLPTLLEAFEGAGWHVRSRIIEPGEASKSLRTLSGIYDWALGGDAPLTRSTPVVAFGGGVVGDLAGFAAATLLRGMPLVQVPSTLLAQVDSAIGGKTGIDHPRGKNLIGAFHQPELVVCDEEVLRSLPRREWASGLAEVIKAALIADRTLFDWLEDAWDDVHDPRASISGDLVKRAVAIKAAIVEADEIESGRRAILNFGHTFGHAIERATGYLVYTHGEAVALGMRAAVHLSGELLPGLDLARADRLLQSLPVPTPLDVSITDLMEAMEVDKKRTPQGLRFVILEEVGRAAIASDVPTDAVRRAWRHIGAKPAHE